MFGSLGIFQAMVAALQKILGTSSDTYATGSLFGYAKYAGSIKSIQRGTIDMTGTATSATATISSVDTNKSVLHFLGFKSNMGGNYSNCAYSVVTLTNATTVTASRQASLGSSDSVTVAYEVVEYY